VCQEVVLSAIVGEEKSRATYHQQMKKLDEIKRRREENQTFTFASLRHKKHQL
jgi:hypothetical protein